MRIGVRAALATFVLVGFAMTAGLVEGVWWWTAQSNATMLAGALNRQATAQVRDDVTSLIAGAEATYGAIATTLSRGVIDVGEEDKREVVFLAQLQGRPTLSWVAFGRRNGTFYAVHKIGEGRFDTIDVAMGPFPREARIDSYRMIGTAAVQSQSSGASTFDVAAQGWYRGATSTPSWSLAAGPSGDGAAALAYAGRVAQDGRNDGVLAVMIDLTRLSRFLANLRVGLTGGAFVLDRDGRAIVPPAEGDGGVGGPAPAELLAAARRARDLMLIRTDPVDMRTSGASIGLDGRRYAVTLTPLDFMGWSVATVIPEEDFLGAVRRTNLGVSSVLAALVLGAAIASALSAGRLIATPLTRLADQIDQVRRFDLGAVRHLPIRLRELDMLSHLVADMAAGLSAFGRFLPADVVSMLTSEGATAEPGGKVRLVTVLFVDIAGFTGLAETMGERVFPLLTRYLEIVSDAIVRQGGTIDKFMGDGVMAFWGAPGPDPDQAAAACRAALDCLERIGSAEDLRDHRGCPFRLRIGINTGEALVGNVGTAHRLNYTAVGDAVNMASRLEAANKDYGTSILIGEATRLRLGPSFDARLVDRARLRGRSGLVDVFELTGEAGRDRPGQMAKCAIDAERSHASADAHPAVGACDAAIGCAPRRQEPSSQGRRWISFVRAIRGDRAGACRRRRWLRDRA